MGTPPRPLQFRKEDYKEAPSWTEKLFRQLNEYLSAVTDNLSAGLTRTENSKSVVKVISFTTKATAADTFPLTVKHDLPQRPTDVWVGRLRRTDIGGAVDAVWSLTWDLDSSGNLSVRFQGLANSAPYEVRLLLE